MKTYSTAACERSTLILGKKELEKYWKYICGIEKNFLQEDIQELQMQLNSMRKSFGHSSIRSNQSNHDMKSTSKNLASDKPASSRSTYHAVTNNTKIDYSTSSG